MTGYEFKKLAKIGRKSTYKNSLIYMCRTNATCLRTCMSPHGHGSLLQMGKVDKLSIFPTLNSVGN